MKTSAAPAFRRVVSAIWRIAAALLPLGVGLAAAALVPGEGDPSAPAALALRVASGIAVSVFTFLVLALLVRRADRMRMRDAGIGQGRSAWRLALWGAIVWTVPAAAAFGVLTLLGAPLTVSVPVSELAGTVLLLLLAVLFAEALPEEAVFRGYVTTALGSVARGWWVVVIQALIFTVFGGLLRQDWNPTDLSLFFSMAIGFGYLRMITGSVWMSVGFHTAFQAGSQLVLAHDVLDFAGSTGTAMVALGVIPFTAAAILVSTTGIPRFVSPRVNGTP